MKFSPVRKMLTADILPEVKIPPFLHIHNDTKAIDDKAGKQTEVDGISWKCTMTTYSKTAHMNTNTSVYT